MFSWLPVCFFYIFTHVLVFILLFLSLLCHCLKVMICTYVCYMSFNKYSILNSAIGRLTLTSWASRSSVWWRSRHTGTRWRVDARSCDCDWETSARSRDESVLTGAVPRWAGTTVCTISWRVRCYRCCPAVSRYHSLHQRWNWVTFCDPATQWPGNRVTGDPVDPVTLFYNKLQMSTYVWRSILRPKNF